jgi:hypothetical protein
MSSAPSRISLFLSQVWMYLFTKYVYNHQVCDKDCGTE